MIDIFHCTNGVDVVWGYKAEVLAFMMDGNDFYEDHISYPSNDTIYGQAGNDRFKSWAGHDVFFGGNGQDEFLIYNQESVTVRGGKGIDSIDIRTDGKAYEIDQVGKHHFIVEFEDHYIDVYSVEKVSWDL